MGVNWIALQLYYAIKLLLLLPFRRLGDKLVWSKIREGLGGRVSTTTMVGQSTAACGCMTAETRPLVFISWWFSQVKVLVSGGSSLPMVLEDFFDVASLTVIVGYGMTETSPVITNRWVRAPPV